MKRKVVFANFIAYLALVLIVWACPRGDFVLVVTDPTRDIGYAVSVVGKARGLFVGEAAFPGSLSPIRRSPALPQD